MLVRGGMTLSPMFRRRGRVGPILPPTQDVHVSALHFGDPRVHALLQAMSNFTLVPEDFRIGTSVLW